MPYDGAGTGAIAVPKCEVLRVALSSWSLGAHVSLFRFLWLRGALLPVSPPIQSKPGSGVRPQGRARAKASAGGSCPIRFPFFYLPRVPCPRRVSVNYPYLPYLQFSSSQATLFVASNPPPPPCLSISTATTEAGATVAAAAAAAALDIISAPSLSPSFTTPKLHLAPRLPCSPLSLHVQPASKCIDTTDTLVGSLVIKS
ncbi:hypothetical protein LZ30DRAFT_793859 [Colletotrichum cereale]|nr:hypothetical protein LZ30DRAFT_793859 [Colletotrichum cereale]